MFSVMVGSAPDFNVLLFKLAHDCLPNGVYVDMLDYHFLFSFSPVPIESFCEACECPEELGGPADIDFYSQIRGRR